jgi:hypothetical protein
VLVASKPAYLPSPYGATRPGRPGTPLLVDAGRNLDITIRLARGAAIEGTIRGGTGRPLPNVDVYALRPGTALVMNHAFMEIPSPESLVRATTDDRGTYRFFGLAPGDYVIAATFPLSGLGEIRRQTEASVELLQRQLQNRTNSPVASSSTTVPALELVSYAPIYYPGTTAFSRAERIRVEVSAERTGVDMTLAPVRTASIEGTVARADGLPLSNVQMSMVLEGLITPTASSFPLLVRAPGPDGRFHYRGVPPGHYTILARVDAGSVQTTLPPGGRGGGMSYSLPVGRSYAIAEVDIVGQDVGGVSLVLRPGASFSAKAVIDAAPGTPVPDLSTLQVGLRGVNVQTSYTMGGPGSTRFGNLLAEPPAGISRPDGSLSIVDIAPGSYRLSAMFPGGLSDRWWLRSAMHNGRDLLDDVLTIGTTSIDGITLTFTDKQNELTGRLLMGDGSAAASYYVVLAPADASLRRPGSRRLKFTRPATDGQYSLRDVPAGDYLLGALTDFEESDLRDQRFLDELARYAIRVTVRDGERTTQDVRLSP